MVQTIASVLDDSEQLMYRGMSLAEPKLLVRNDVPFLDVEARAMQHRLFAELTQCRQ